MAERKRADVAWARRRWIREQGVLDPAHLVFIDETAITTNIVRLNGWSPRGERLVGHAPMEHWETVTFIAGLRQTGIVAPMLIKAAMNGEAFLAYIDFLPQSLWRGGGDSDWRRKPPLPAAVFAGPDRVGVPSVENSVAQGCGADDRGAGAMRQIVHSNARSCSMSAIFQTRRLRTIMIGTCFSRSLPTIMEIPVKELPMRKIESRSHLTNQKFGAAAFVVAALAVTSTLARAQDAAGRHAGPYRG
jgi:hypothetical protein